MERITPQKLRDNLDNLLDEILTTGIPLEIVWGGKRLGIIPVEPLDKLDKLVYRPHVILGDADTLIDINWVQEINFNLP